MCKFFSFVTEPESHGGDRFYFNWDVRKSSLSDKNDSHTHICKIYNLDEDKCNKYEYNPLTKKFGVDQINSEVNDRIQAEAWVKRLNFQKIVEPLIIKPIVNPFNLTPVKKVTKKQIVLLKEWYSVRDRVGDSVRDRVGDSVGNIVWDSAGNIVGDSVVNIVWDSVWDSVGNIVRDRVGYSVWAYVSSFFAIDYLHDFSSATRIWEMGLMPSFDGVTWRLHTGKDAHIVYEITEKELKNV
jgi:hypothetical protein